MRIRKRMSAEEFRHGPVLGLALILGFPAGAAAAGEEVAELEFLEYLGSWEESDEDWLLFRAVENEPVDQPEERIDPVPTGEESTETQDET